MLRRQRNLRMKEYIEVLEQTSLFSGITKEDIEIMLKCLDARQIEYKRNEMIIWEGSIINDIGIILSGHARSIKTDASGKLIIVTLLGKGSYTGVLLAASRKRKSPVSVQIQDDISLLSIPIDKIVSQCSRSCSKHKLLLYNYLNIIAEKSMVLHDRIDCLVKHSVRDKVLAYLLRVSKENESRTFTIPLDRKAMAEYLNVERSALSRELSKMKKDGLIDFYKNGFKLL